MASYTGGMLSDHITMYWKTTGFTFVEKSTEPSADYADKIYFESVGSPATTYNMYLYDGSKFVLISVGETTSSPAKIQLQQLQAIPSLGGSTNKVDVTCLEDEAHRYINGLKDYGDSIDFTFLYDRINYGLCNTLGTDTTYAFEIDFNKLSSDSTTGDVFTFSGKPSAALNDVAVDSALTFTFSLALQTKITYTAGY